MTWRFRDSNAVTLLCGATAGRNHVGFIQDVAPLTEENRWLKVNTTISETPPLSGGTPLIDLACDSEGPLKTGLDRRQLPK